MSLSTLVIDLAAGFHLHLSLDLALTYLVQAKYNEVFFLLHGRRKVHILNIQGKSNVFASRSISVCANIYICRSGKYKGLPKRVNKLLPILEGEKKWGFTRGAVRIHIILAYRYQPWRLILVLRNK